MEVALDQALGRAPCTRRSESSPSESHHVERTLRQHSAIRRGVLYSSRVASRHQPCVVSLSSSPCTSSALPCTPDPGGGGELATTQVLGVA